MNSDDDPNKDENISQDDKDKLSKTPAEGANQSLGVENAGGNQTQNTATMAAIGVAGTGTTEVPKPEPLKDQDAINVLRQALQAINDQIADKVREATDRATLAQARAAWIASLVPALDNEIEMQEQQIIATRAAENLQRVASDVAEALTKTTNAFKSIESTTNLDTAQQVKATIDQIAADVIGAVQQSQVNIDSAKNAVTNAKTYAAAPLWGNELEKLRLQGQGCVPIVAIVAVVIIIFLIIWSLGNEQVAWVFVGIVASVILISVGFYRPQRVRITQSRASTTASGGKTEAPSLPSTHPAVLALGIYMVIFMLLCLGLVLDIGSQSSDLQLAPTPTPSATSTPEMTSEAKASSASQVNVIRVDVHSVAAQATEAATAEPTQEATSEATAQPDTGTNSPQSNTPSKQIYFIHLPDRTIPITPETRLLLLIVLSGALGGLLKSIQSYRLYLGEDNFKGTWIMYYVTEPFVGGVLALLFYVVIRGGLFSNDSIQSANTFGLVATSGLVGLFNGQAMKKLKQIAETVFTANVSQDPLEEDQKKEDAKNTPITSSSGAIVNPQTGVVALVEETTKKADTSTG